MIKIKKCLGLSKTAVVPLQKNVITIRPPATAAQLAPCSILFEVMSVNPHDKRTEPINIVNTRAPRIFEIVNSSREQFNFLLW